MPGHGSFVERHDGGGVRVLLFNVQGGIRGLSMKIYPEFEWRRLTIFRNRNAVLAAANSKCTLSIMHTGRGLLNIRLVAGFGLQLDGVEMWRGPMTKHFALQRLLCSISGFQPLLLSTNSINLFNETEKPRLRELPLIGCHDHLSISSCTHPNLGTNEQAQRGRYENC